jgi:hypothetical protein
MKKTNSGINSYTNFQIILIIITRARDFMPLKTLKYVCIYALKNQ